MSPRDKFLLLLSGYLAALNTGQVPQNHIWDALLKARSWSDPWAPEELAWEYANYVLGLGPKPRSTTPP